MSPRVVNDLLQEALAVRDLDDQARADIIADLAERDDLFGEQPQAHDECRKLVDHLVHEASALFSFLAQHDVDATNWRAEQAIRPPS